MRSSEIARHIEVSGQRVGVLVLRRVEGALSLEHLYLHPDAQGRGLGSMVLERVIAEASSNSCRFGSRHCVKAMPIASISDTASC